MQLRKDIFGVEEKSRQGNIKCNAFWGFWPTDKERYINPKMEEELIVTKANLQEKKLMIATKTKTNIYI